MDVTLSLRLTESDHLSIKKSAGPYSNLSTVLVSAMRPYLEGKKILPSKTKGKERQTTCSVDHTIKEALVSLAEDHGLSTNEAIQFMVYDFTKGQK